MARNTPKKPQLNVPSASCSSDPDAPRTLALKPESTAAAQPSEAILVSACLLGVHCRYDGSSNPAPELEELTRGKRIVPICPEEMGGLGTPRRPAQLHGGGAADVLAGNARVQTQNDQDVTVQYLTGADEAVRRAQETGARQAILKERSPSCGVCHVYQDGQLVSGRGITAERLAAFGLDLIPLDPPKRR